MDERRKLEHAIAQLEAQRETLGDVVVETALAPLRKKLEQLAEQGDFPYHQRKLVTILFTDIANSTRLSQHLDPEDVRDIFDVALNALAKPISAYDGKVTRFMGDGFLAVFGVPQAREDDPERAIRAGLDILKEASDLALQLKVQREFDDFDVRVGINTGLIALGGMTEAEDTLMGSAVNLAARLESTASPGELLISHNTYRHVRGVFDVESKGSIQVKGFPDPVQVYQVQRAMPRAFRLRTMVVEGVETRMVGRDGELKLLQDTMNNAIQVGEGQVVTVVGDAGVGKSRLLNEFLKWLYLIPERVKLYQGRSWQETQKLPYALLREMFSFRFLIQEGDTVLAVREKIESGIGEILGNDETGLMRAHIIGQLLGFDFSDSLYLRDVMDDPEQLRNRGLLYLKEYFQCVASEGPVLIVLEDLHWTNDSSLDVLNQLGRITVDYPLVILCSTRPNLYERRPYWGEGRLYHTRVDLSPISRWDSRQLIMNILRLVDELPESIRELIVDLAEGNPYFIEELVKMLIDQGVIVTGDEYWRIEVERLELVKVPSTLIGVLQARLDDLPSDERQILQEASIIGRVFWDEVITYMHRITDGQDTDDETARVLHSLRDKEMIYRREVSTFAGVNEFIFKHDVLRDVTYETVLKRKRLHDHALVAEWLIERHEERSVEYAGLIAEHLILAGRDEKALGYLYQAGEQAMRSFANQEAIEFFTHALELTPEDEKVQHYKIRSAREKVYDIQGSREAQEQDLTDLEALANEAKDVDWQIGAALRFANFAEKTSRYQDAISSAEKAIQLAKESGQAERESEGYLVNGIALMRQGEYESAREKLKHALELAEDTEFAPTRAKSLTTLGIIDFEQGNNLQAIDYHQQALEIFKEIGDKVSEGYSLNSLGTASLSIGEYADTEEYLEQAFHIFDETGNRLGKGFVLNNLARTFFDMGDLDKALEYYERALDIFREIENWRGEAAVLNNIGEVACTLEEYQKGYDYYRQALELSRLMGNRPFEGFALYGVADSQYGLGNFDEAERGMIQAIDVHEELGWRDNAMDARGGLARVLLAQGELKEAYDVVSEILVYLDEGHSLRTDVAPFRLFLTCYTVLTAVQDPRSLGFLESSYGLLRKRADEIKDESVRHAFLENIPWHSELIAEAQAQGIFY